LVEFLSLYQSSTYFDTGKSSEKRRKRASRLLKMLADIKFQSAQIMFEISNYNHFLYAGQHEDEEILKNPKLLFIKLSIDQNVIIKNRIVLEKLMNFIYYLDKDEKLSSSKSKKAEFLKHIKNTKWDYLLKYEKVFKDYDEDLRTNEVHAISNLSNCFHEKENPEKYLIGFAKLNVINNLVMNMFWLPLVEILKGKTVNQLYWDKGMEELSEIKSGDILK
jgi:hypothetical protein